MEFNYHLLRFFCKNYNNDKISDLFEVGQSIFRKFAPKPCKSIQNSKLQMFDLISTCLHLVFGQYQVKLSFLLMLNYVERKHRDFHGTTDRVYPKQCGLHHGTAFFSHVYALDREESVNATSGLRREW